MATAPIHFPICSLLLFVATPTELEGLETAAVRLGVKFRSDAGVARYLSERGLGDKVRLLGPFGAEMVLAIHYSREQGQVVMGAHGRLGSAAKAVRYLHATGAQGILQVGMAFGVSRTAQNLGDVLVSSLLIPYDNRDVIPSTVSPGHRNDYSKTKLEPARSSLVNRCKREMARSRFDFEVHIGALLSGAARIHCAAYRNELYNTVPHEAEPIVGGEMEGVGLLAASLKANDPAWCVVKGISDFADEHRDEDLKEGREKACVNAAYFVLSSLINDANELASGGDS